MRMMGVGEGGCVTTMRVGMARAVNAVMYGNMMMGGARGYGVITVSVRRRG